MKLTTYPTGKLINAITDAILLLDKDGSKTVVGDVLETRLITVPAPPKNVSKHMVQVIALATISGLKIKRERTIDVDFYERYGLSGKSVKEAYRPVLPPVLRQGASSSAFVNTDSGGEGNAVGIL